MQNGGNGQTSEGGKINTSPTPHYGAKNSVTVMIQIAAPSHIGDCESVREGHLLASNHQWWWGVLGGGGWCWVCLGGGSVIMQNITVGKRTVWWCKTTFDINDIFREGVKK